MEPDHDHEVAHVSGSAACYWRADIHSGRNGEFGPTNSVLHPNNRIALESGA